jgi:metacaspase-1
LIGINYVGQGGELKGCINDVLNMKRFIKDEGYSEENIRVMTEASNVASLVPTAENIICGFDWLCEGATSESELFLHYSGHGGSIKDASGDEMDRKDETICPLDYSYRGQITDDLIRARLIDYHLVAS